MLRSDVFTITFERFFACEHQSKLNSTQNKVNVVAKYQAVE